MPVDDEIGHLGTAHLGKQRALRQINRCARRGAGDKAAPRQIGDKSGTRLCCGKLAGHGPARIQIVDDRPDGLRQSRHHAARAQDHRQFFIGGAQGGPQPRGFFRGGNFMCQNAGLGDGKQTDGQQRHRQHHAKHHSKARPERTTRRFHHADSITRPAFPSGA